jgi:ATP-dependent Clp protease protease subunit
MDKKFNDFRNFYKDRNPFGMTAFDDITKSPSNYINPSIIEERELHITQLDVFSRLMMDRQIYFGNEVNSDTCNITIAQLLYMDSVSNEDITMYVNSPGGSVIDGLGLIDTMGMIKSDVVTVGTGMAASMGSLIISSGARGKRKALANSWVMLHQLSSGVKGKFKDILVEAEFCKRLTEKLYNHLSQRTGQPYDKIVEACENGDKWFSAEEAKDFGLIDEVIYPKWD